MHQGLQVTSKRLLLKGIHSTYESQVLCFLENTLQLRLAGILAEVDQTLVERKHGARWFGEQLMQHWSVGEAYALWSTRKDAASCNRHHEKLMLPLHGWPGTLACWHITLGQHSAVHWTQYIWRFWDLPASMATSAPILKRNLGSKSNRLRTTGNALEKNLVKKPACDSKKM